MFKYRCNCVIVLSAKIENMHKALNFNTTILLGNNYTNVPAESLFAEEFTHSFSTFERKEFHWPVYNDKASFIIELIKCSLLRLLLQHSLHQMCFPRFSSCIMLIEIKINSLSLFFTDVNIVELVLDVL